MGKSKSFWINSGKFTFLERLLMLFFGVLNFYLLVRILDKESYGTWIFFLTITTLLDTARHGFFQNPLIRFLNLEEKKNSSAKNLQLTSFLLNLSLSTVTSIIMLAVAYPFSRFWNSPQLIYLFAINLVTNIFHSFFFHFDYLLKAYMRFKGAFFSMFVKGLTLLAFTVFLYFSEQHPDLITIAVFYSLAAFSGALTSLFFVKDIFLVSAKPDRRLAKELCTYGSYTLGSNISAVFMRYIDTWMLGFFISPVAVAVYNVAIRIANLFEVPSMALASILYPKAVQKAKEEGEKAFKSLYEKSVTVILLLTTPLVIFVILFSDLIVLHLAGEGYQETAGVLKITMLYGLIVPFNKQMGILLDAIGKAKLNMVFVTRNAVINLILNAIYIPAFGTIGAAYATLSTMMVVWVMNQIYLSKNFKIELRNLFSYSKQFFFLFLSYFKSRISGYFN